VQPSRLFHKNDKRPTKLKKFKRNWNNSLRNKLNSQSLISKEKSRRLGTRRAGPSLFLFSYSQAIEFRLPCRPNVFLCDYFDRHWNCVKRSMEVLECQEGSGNIQTRSRFCEEIEIAC
jgi:hypothetical protein